MNNDSPCQLVDRYLDGLTTPEDAAALTEAVEADPDVLAWLCESAELEASLQTLLAPEPRAFVVPRILPFWHWRRAGKWLSAGAAAAALLAIAALVLWPRGGAGGEIVQHKSRVEVKRFAAGQRPAEPLQPPGEETDSMPLEEAEFHPDEKWRQELLTVSVASSPFPSEVTETDDERLQYYLRAAGVTFPKGAAVRWLPGKTSFLAVNNRVNLDRLTAISRDPDSHGPRLVSLGVVMFRFAPGEVIPPVMEKEKVLSAEEPQWPDTKIPEGTRYSYGSLYSGIGLSQANYSAIIKPETPGTDPNAKVELYNCRAGGNILISGLSADMEFSVTLKEKEAAVLHLGRGADGNYWIMMMYAALVLPPVAVEIRDVPNVMKFDTPLVTVKARTAVELTHRNEKCALMHNFVLVKPGRLTAVGALADKMLAEQDALAKLYIPDSPDIIVAGKKLLRAGELEHIFFVAPDEPGDYPYLCTFPGHWRLQNGILRVVP